MLAASIDVLWLVHGSRPIHTADADATQLSSWLASAVWTHPSAVVTQFTNSCAVRDKWRHNDVNVEKKLWRSIKMYLVKPICSVSKLLIESVGSRRELGAYIIVVANFVHTANADATQPNSTVKSRRRRRCVLGITSDAKQRTFNCVFHVLLSTNFRTFWWKRRASVIYGH